MGSSLQTSSRKKVAELTLSSDTTRVALRGYGGRALILVVLKALEAIASLLPPFLVGVLIDAILHVADSQRFLLYGLAIPGAYATTGLLALLESFLRTRTANSIVLKWRTELFRSFLHGDVASMGRRHPGDLVKRIDEDVECVGGLLGASVDRWFHGTQMSVSAVACVVISWQLAIVAATLAGCVWLVGHLIAARKLPVSAELTRRWAAYMAWIHESVEKWKEVRSLGIEPHQHNRMRNFMQDVDSVRGRRHYFFVANQALGHLQRQFLTSATIYLVGAFLLASGSLTLGLLLAFLRYSQRVMASVEQMTVVINGVADLVPRFERVVETRRWPRELGVLHRGYAAAVPLIDFQRVSFAYDDNDILRDVTFRIHPGSLIGVTGSTGAGKSTLIRLICAELKASGGIISIDGRNVESEGRGGDQQLFAVAGRDSIVFSGTIRDNLRLADPHAEEAELLGACDAAHLGEFVRGGQDGLESEIGEAGSGLSDGERQRLVLARTLLLNRPVVVLDEALSQVEGPLAQAIMENIRQSLRRPTVIVVSHRDLFSDLVDQRLHVQGGRVSVSGAGPDSSVAAQ